MQQWGVGIGECGRGGTAAAKVDCSGNAGGGTDLLTEAGWPALEGGNRDGPEEQGAARHAKRLRDPGWVGDKG